MKKINTYFWNILFICVLIFALAACGHRGGGGKDVEVEEIKVPHRYGFDPDTLSLYQGRVGSNEYFSSLLGRLGLDSRTSYGITQACDSVFDVRKFRTGNAFAAYYSPAAPSDSLAGGMLSAPPEGMTPEYLVYERDALTDLVIKCREPYSAWISEKPIEIHRRKAEVTIRSSLWEDMTQAGVTPLLILKLSDIYAWTVDFFALQKEDSFKVLYDETVCEGKVIAVDTVVYAVFRHADTQFPCIMFDQGDGGNIYWNEKGESMRKEFLKAPLQYSRISSGFSYARRHPITRRVQPHTGVDYAAPAGTPVMSIGDGKVISAKHEGAGGNTVRIRHNSVYTTAYLHLSRYAPGIKAGAMVKQGDVIGYVGSTGRSTGPHLDFRVWKNGSAINPLKMESPPAEPLKEENMPAFLTLADSLSRTVFAGEEPLAEESGQ